MSRPILSENCFYSRQMVNLEKLFQLRSFVTFQINEHFVVDDAHFVAEKLLSLM